MLSPLSTTLRLVSRLACLIVLASFALFAIDQAGNASAHQQNAVDASAPPSIASSLKAPPAPSKKSSTGVRHVIDEASSAITSPFSGAVAGVHNEWASRGALTALALLIYGFGLGFLARFLRVRV